MALSIALTADRGFGLQVVVVVLIVEQNQTKKVSLNPVSSVGCASLLKESA